MHLLETYRATTKQTSSNMNLKTPVYIVLWPAVFNICI